VADAPQSPQQQPIEHVEGLEDEGQEELLSRLNPTVPHSARIWNYLLGGKDNFPVDRQAGDMVSQVFPGMVTMTRQSRQMLVRAVRYLADEAGIRQYLDVGTGLPTAANTHEVTQQSPKESRIVYVDNDRCKSGCAHATRNWLP
jgi:S-adenosyl methyltransferase